MADTKFTNSLGDYDGDNPANWDQGLPRAGYSARIQAPVIFSNGYTCDRLYVDSETTPVTLGGGVWTILVNSMDFTKGIVTVTAPTTVDGALQIVARQGTDCALLAVHYTRARSGPIDAAVPIGDVVLAPPDGYYVNTPRMNCATLRIEGQGFWSCGIDNDVTVRGDTLIKAGATVIRAYNTPPQIPIKLYGNLIAEAGAWTWTTNQVGGAVVVFLGSGNRVIDLGGMVGVFSPLAIEMDGTLTAQSDIRCGAVDHRAGTFDPAGRSIVTAKKYNGDSGNSQIHAGAKLATPLDGSTWTVGGNLEWIGLVGDLLGLKGNAPWWLSVAGSSIVRYVDVAYSDARGSAAPIDATDETSVDGGHNLNWLFPRVLTPPFSVAAGGLYVPGTAAGQRHVPGPMSGRPYSSSPRSGQSYRPEPEAAQPYRPSPESGQYV